MTSNADPWRTLGLSPGATPDEIRRAYRRLAKVNHPDAAGEAALPRFLAIQAAYEQLAGPAKGRRVGGRPAGAGDGPPERREPWRADPNRARASGRADGRRTPGARPPGAGPRTRAQDSGSGFGPADASGGAGAPGAPGPGRPRRPSSRRRPPNRATPGSTSYEGADEEPFEPGWTGATWYGASSGTYWTINPKEYADPRKHGPEYQARARRTRAGWILDDSGATADPESDAQTAETDPTAPPSDADATGPEPPASDPSAEPIAMGHAWRRPGGGRHWTDPRPGVRMPGEATAAGGEPSRDPDVRTTGGAAAAGPPSGGLRSWIDVPEDAGSGRVPLLRQATTPAGRVAMALLGWPPLGLFAGAVIDQSTGCGTYAASCAEVSAPGTWLLQAAIVILLLALPAVAAWSAHGTIAALLVGVPSAVLLSAAGGTNVRATSGPILLGVLALAYLAGVAYAVVARRRPRPI